jgi:hypothetical protein
MEKLRDIRMAAVSSYDKLYVAMEELNAGLKFFLARGSELKDKSAPGMPRRETINAPERSGPTRV